MAFTRTAGGLVQKWRFYSVPTIWVEGPTDIQFYEPILSNTSCRLEAFHGVANAQALLDALLKYNYPYIVIVDGDYNILHKPTRTHRRLIELPRYSVENLLWEHESVNRAALRHAQCGEPKNIVDKEMKRVEKHLKSKMTELIVLDVAARRSPSPPAVLPKAIEQLLADPKHPNIDSVKVASLIASVKPQVPRSALRAAKRDVADFLRSRPITHLLKGHLLLGILSRVFHRMAEKENAAAGLMPHSALVQILSEMVWRRCSCDDHRELKRKLRSAVSKVWQMFPAPRLKA